MSRTHRTPITALLLVAVFAAAGCKYDGKWEGTTSQGKTLSFTVNGGAITSAKVEFELKCERPGFCPSGGSIEQDLSAKVSGNIFSAAMGKATLSGRFDSEAQATGELKIEETNPQCGDCNARIPWTAKKL